MNNLVIQTVDPIHKRYFRRIDDDIVEVTFYEIMGDRAVRLGSVERWKREEAAEWYGVSL